MQIVRQAKIVSATLDEEVAYDDGPPLNKFLIDLEVDGERKGDLVMWLPKGGRAEPPMEGETGDFELEQKKYGIKVKRHRAQQSGNFRGGGGGGGGGNFRPTAPEDAKRMSRSTALNAAVALGAAQETVPNSDAILSIAGRFAEFIYGEKVT